MRDRKNDENCEKSKIDDGKGAAVPEFYWKVVLGIEILPWRGSAVQVHLVEDSLAIADAFNAIVVVIRKS